MAGGADLIVSGHDHHYERFVPADARGHRDASGPLWLVAGTGGAPLRAVTSVHRLSAERIDDRHGVVEVIARDGVLEASFVPTRGAIVPAGERRCHAGG